MLPPDEPLTEDSFGQKLKQEMIDAFAMLTLDQRHAVATLRWSEGGQILVRLDNWVEDHIIRGEE